MARSTPTADLVSQAARLLPTLDKVEEHLEKDPDDVLARAFPAEDPGFHPLGEADGGEEAFESLEAPALLPAVHRHRKNLVRAARSAIRKVHNKGADANLTEEEAEGLEAIVLTVGRPAILFKGGRFLPTPPPWEGLQDARKEIETSARSVGRIELFGQPGMPYAGTGFVVADGVVMTNRHVARLFSQQSGRGAWTFREGLTAGIDYTDAPEDGKPAAFAVERVLGVHNKYDLALLKLGKGAAKKGKAPTALPVAAKAPAAIKGRQVYVLGYPARDPRNGEAAMRNIFGDVYNVKRLQPGNLLTFVRAEGVFKHDSSTLGGNSGSCVLDLETHRVLGLHFGGIYQKYN
jgi:V8-like Glu-specific endopeptidase